MAMVKIIDPSGWDFDRPVAQMVKVSKYGLRGQDRDDFIKIASPVFLDLLDNIKLAKDEIPIHLVAMGASEAYGCFFAGAPVQTYTGQVPIERVAAGDLVLTHRNRYRSVNKTFTKPYKGPACEIRVSGLPEDLPSTAKHPYQVVRKEDFVKKQRCESLNRNNPGWTRETAVRDAVSRSKWVDADTLREGDMLVIPCSPTDPTAEPLAEDLAYLMGVYAAEGCVCHKYAEGSVDDSGRGKLAGAVFTMAKSDENAFVRMREIAEGRGHTLYEDKSYTSEKGWRLTLYSQEIAGQLEGLFGRTSHTKRIPPVVFSQSDDWKLQFLAGYFDGDGCVTTESKHTRYLNRLRANTVSRDLALDLQKLLASLLVPSAVSRSYNRESSGCFGKGDLPIYELNVGGAYSSKILNHCQRLESVSGGPKIKQARMYMSGDYLLMPITSVRMADVDTTIYNLEVAQDNSYVVDTAVHNSNRNGDGFKEAMLKRCHPTFEKHARWYRNHCNKNPKESYGYVKKSAYNEDMRRVELLGILNASKEAADRNGGFVADREMDRIDRGEDIPVSMAIRVPYDTCSSCGNKARTRDDYCVEKTCVGPDGEKRGGCKNNLTKVGEDGHILHVDNPDGTFFDISDVFRPADRIAYGGKADYLQKAASHDFMPGAELADCLGVTAPLDVILATDLMGNPANADQIKLAHGMARLEGMTQTSDSVKMAMDRQVLTPIDAKSLTGLGLPGTEKGAALLGALADRQVILTLDDFATWLGKEALAAEAGRLAPRMYNEIVNAGDIDQQLTNSPFNCYGKHPSGAQKAAAAGLAQTHGLNRDATQSRAMKASIRNITPAVKTAADRDGLGHVSTEARQLVRTYGLYKLATLHRIAGFDPDFNLTVRLALAQNGV